MNDAIPIEPGTQIDARPLLVWEAIRGAFMGLLYSDLPAWGLTLALPDLKVTGFAGAVGIAALLVISAMAFGAAIGVCQGRDRTLTDEQRAVVRKHIRRAATRATLYATPLAGVVLLGIALATYLLELEPKYGSPSSRPPRDNAVAVIGLGVGTFYLQIMWIGVAALVGWSRGMAVVDAMQRSTRATAGAISGRLGPWADARPDDRRQGATADPDRRFGEMPEARPVADGRLEE